MRPRAPAASHPPHFALGLALVCAFAALPAAVGNARAVRIPADRVVYAFDAADRDESGTLDALEQWLLPKALRDTWIDANRDHLISLAELPHPRISAPPSRGDLDIAFAAADRNGDGKLSPAEFRRLPASLRALATPSSKDADVSRRHFPQLALVLPPDVAAWRAGVDAAQDAADAAEVAALNAGPPPANGLRYVAVLRRGGTDCGGYGDNRILIHLFWPTPPADLKPGDAVLQLDLAQPTATLDPDLWTYPVRRVVAGSFSAPTVTVRFPSQPDVSEQNYQACTGARFPPGADLAVGRMITEPGFGSYFALRAAGVEAHLTVY